MKRFFLIFLAFTVSLSVFSVLLPETAKAASPYDTIIDPYPPNAIPVPGSIGTATTQDFINNAKFSGTTYTTLGTCNYTPEVIKQAITDNHDYYITVINGAGTYLVIDVVGDGFNQDWQDLGSGNGRIAMTPVSGNLVSLYWETGFMYCTNTPANFARNYGGERWRPAELNFELNYPAGYEGPVLNPIVEGDNFAPEIGFHVTTENEIKALSIAPQDLCIPVGLTEVTGCIQPRLFWQVYAPDHTTVLDQRSTEIFTPYSFRLPGNDTYYFEVSYTHPGPPFAPFNDSAILVKTTFIINANGTFVVGGTGVQDCSIVGGVNECGAPDPLEDCSTYGVDIGGYFQCIINNFGIWLRNVLIDLFVPRYSFFTSWTDEFGQFLNSKLGFVYTSFATITTLFTGIISNGASGTCAINPPGELFGATVSFDVCYFEETFGSTIWGLMQGVVISLTILALAFAGYRKYLEVVDHR